MGAGGILLTLLAFALGGYSIETGPVNPTKLSVGLDWLLLDLLGSALVFVFIEQAFPKYKAQPILRPEWGPTSSTWP